MVLEKLPTKSFYLLQQLSRQTMQYELYIFLTHTHTFV